MKITGTGSNPKTLWVLTTEHLKLFKQLGIQFHQLKDLLNFSYVVDSDQNIVERLAMIDLVNFAELQYQFRLLFNKESTPIEFNPGVDSTYNDLAFSKIKSAILAKSKLEHLTEFKRYSKYYVGTFQDTIVLLVGTDQKTTNYISEYEPVFTELQCTSIKAATLNTFYHVFGYDYLHFRDREISKTNDELTLEDVFVSIA